MTSDLRLAQCLKCRAYTLLGVETVAYAVEVAEADRTAYIDAVVRRRALVAVEKRPGRPPRGRLRGLGTLEPSFDENGAQRGVQRLHVEHPCPARDQRPVKGADTGPPSAPATPGVSRGGSHRPAAPAGAARGRDSRSPAPSATRRRSDPHPPGVRCHICRKLIDQKSQEFSGIFHERWIWAVHEKCDA